MNIPRALTIAGSAARGGAGIQADLKTFQEFDVFGTSAVTAIVARNQRTGRGIFPQEWEAIEAQLDTIASDIGMDALKTGMLFTEEIIERSHTTVPEKISDDLSIEGENSSTPMNETDGPCNNKSCKNIFRGWFHYKNKI